MKNKYIIKTLWQAVADQNPEGIRQCFAPNAHILWHNTNERFSLEEFVRANCEYPGEWQGEVESVEETRDATVAVARVWTEDAAFRCVGFYRMLNGRIVRADEYWGDVGCAPEWRQELKIGTPIRN